YDWLKACQPRLHIDWQRSASSQGVRLHWLIDRSQRALLERLLLERKLASHSSLVDQQILRYEFEEELPQVVFVASIAAAENGDGKQENDRRHWQIAGVEYQFESPTSLEVAEGEIEPSDWLPPEAAGELADSESLADSFRPL